jgi:hypothetical protein
MLNGSEAVAGSACSKQKPRTPKAAHKRMPLHCLIFALKASR